MKYGFQGKLAASDNLYASFAKIQIPFDEEGFSGKIKLHIFYGIVTYLTQKFPKEKKVLQNYGVD